MLRSTLHDDADEGADGSGLWYGWGDHKRVGEAMEYAAEAKWRLEDWHIPDEDFLKMFHDDGGVKAVEALISGALKASDAQSKTFYARLLVTSGGPIEDVAQIVRWTPDWLERVLKRSPRGYVLDGRRFNRRPMVYRTEEVIEAVSLLLSKKPPDGRRWKARHISEFMVSNLGFPHVHIRRAAEVLQHAQELSRKKRRLIYSGTSLRRPPYQP